MLPKRAMDSITETEDSCYVFKGKLLCSFMYKVWSRTGATGHIIRGLFSEALMQVTNGADDFEFYLIFIDFNPNIDLHLATVLVR